MLGFRKNKEDVGGGATANVAEGTPDLKTEDTPADLATHRSNVNEQKANELKSDLGLAPEATHAEVMDAVDAGQMPTGEEIKEDIAA